MVVGLFGESPNLAVVGGVGVHRKWGRGSCNHTVVTTVSSQAAGGACGEQGRSLSRQVCTVSAALRQRKVSCTEAQSSCSPSWLCLRQDLHHVAQAILL